MMPANYENKEPIDMRCRHLWSVKSRMKNEKYQSIFLKELIGLFLNDEIANDSLDAYLCVN